MDKIRTKVHIKNELGRALIAEFMGTALLLVSLWFASWLAHFTFELNPVTALFPAHLGCLFLLSKLKHKLFSKRF